MRLYAERALKYIAQAKAQEPNLREPDAISAMEFGARRIDFLGLKFQLADEMVDGYAQAQGTAFGDGDGASGGAAAFGVGDAVGY